MGNIVHPGSSVGLTATVGVGLGSDNTLNPRLVVLNIEGEGTQKLLLTRSTMDNQIEYQLTQSNTQKIDPRVLPMLTPHHNADSCRYG
jgi:hypothetical protein